ncbi:MAG: ABC transporter permease, partial [Actinomycetia bacterium]|nr:ABC transporter permease [Actinomycetes bacterium]
MTSATDPKRAPDDLHADDPLVDDSARENSPSARFKASVRHFVRSQPLGLAALSFIVLLVLFAIFADLITSFEPTIQNRRDIKASPNGTFYFGTDHLGRDVFARIIYGSRISLVVAGSVVFFSTFIGVIVGGVSGYFGGWVDLILQRIVDAIMSIPVLILALF